jgi:hypothetical protein
MTSQCEAQCARRSGNAQILLVLLMICQFEYCQNKPRGSCRQRRASEMLTDTAHNMWSDFSNSSAYTHRPTIVML